MPKTSKTPKKTKFRRLIFDIEVSPNVGLFWGSGYRINIPPENILEERAIVCIAWKWEDEKTIHCKAWDKNHNDKALLEKFLPVLHSADEIVTHHGNRFDVPWIRTRCIIHDISMSPYFTSQDTCQSARTKFKFNSNKLTYIAKVLKVGEKTLTNYDLWKDVVKGNVNALKTMKDYCKNDVRILEGVFRKMSPYLPAKSNIAKYIHECPECGGQTTITKRRTTAKGYKQIQFQCKECGKYSTVAASRYEKQGRIK